MTFTHLDFHNWIRQQDNWKESKNGMKKRDISDIVPRISFELCMCAFQSDWLKLERNSVKFYFCNCSFFPSTKDLSLKRCNFSIECDFDVDQFSKHALHANFSKWMNDEEKQWHKRSRAEESTKWRDREKRMWAMKFPKARAGMLLTMELHIVKAKR